jgi:hypothetical protein
MRDPNQMKEHFMRMNANLGNMPTGMNAGNFHFDPNKQVERININNFNISKYIN